MGLEAQTGLRGCGNQALLPGSPGQEAWSPEPLLCGVWAPGLHAAPTPPVMAAAPFSWSQLARWDAQMGKCAPSSFHGGTIGTGRGCAQPENLGAAGPWNSWLTASCKAPAAGSGMAPRAAAWPDGVVGAGPSGGRWRAGGEASPFTFFPSSLTSTRPSWTAPTSDIPM